MFKVGMIQSTFLMLFLSGIALADTINGTSGNDVLIGTDGDDLIIGGAGNDTLTGGRGNDRLEGGSGSDTYIFNLGDGQDVILDYGGGSSGTDRVVMGPDVTREMVRLGNNGKLSTNQDLVVLVGNGGDSITIKDHYHSYGYWVLEEIVIEGITYKISELQKTEWEYTQGATTGNDTLYGTAQNNWMEGSEGNDILYGRAGNDYLRGGAGNDTLYGDAGNDTLEGGTGNDRLEGGSGSDTYIFNLGDGQDTIFDTGGTDSLMMGAGISVADLQWSQSGNNLILSVGNAGDQITFLSHYSSSSYQIEQIQVLGKTYTWAQLTAAKAHNALNITRMDTSANDGLLFIDVEFNFPIDPYSFTYDDVVVSDEYGQQYSLLSIQAITDKRYRIISTLIIDGSYTVTIGPDINAQNGQLLDQNNNGITGELADSVTKSFLLDQTLPASTQLNPYPDTVNTPTYTFRGTKEAGSKVLNNGVVIASAGASTSWAYVANLSDGINEFNFVVEDANGNRSVGVAASITYHNTIPGPVTFNVNPQGNGKELTLSWASYDEYSNGNDIKHYKIYISTTDFSSVTELTAIQTINKGIKTAKLTNLVRNQTYYVAVVAEDTSGQIIDVITAVSATPIDTTPPARISNLQVESGFDQLQLSWDAVSDVDVDLAGYRIEYIDQGEEKVINLTVGEVGSINPIVYTLNNLQPATAHNLRISSLDVSGNKSTVTTHSGITFLSNPESLQAEALDSGAELRWIRSTPHSLLKHYAVYVSSEMFTSVTGMEPYKIVNKGSSNQTSISTLINGLSNGTKVYVAVTAVNNSNGELKEILPVAVTPQSDTDGPQIISADFISGVITQSLEESPTLTKSGKFSIKATDKSTVSRAIFTLNDEVLGNVLITNTQGAYEQALDLVNLSDGTYTLSVDVYDQLENVTQKTYTINIDLSAPSIPSIENPILGTTINQTTITISGKSVVGTQISIVNNGADVVANVPVDFNGNYSATIDVQEGDNLIAVRAQYVDRIKWSDYSATRKVVVNTQIPDAPSGLGATSAKQGQIHLAWNAVTSSNANNQVKGYNIYRADAAFSHKDDVGVSKVNSQLIVNNSFSNLVAADGTYYYAVTAVNQANNESLLSSVVNADADSIGPKIIELTYTSNGLVDATSGRMGRGNVSIVATFNEPLRNNPYFAIVPENGLPISIDLVKSHIDETIYSGEFTIDESTGSGTAYAVMSAFDNTGNRGTDIEQGGSLLIDTQGPDLNQLSIAPVEPLKVDAINGLAVTVSIRLSEPLNQMAQPKLIPLIDGVAVAGFEQGIAFSELDDPLVFSGEFTLPHTTAETSMAILSFVHQAEDDLGNISTKIIGQNQFQVYQGDLPPLDMPSDLTATALPGGKVKLRWRPVEKTAGYTLYRQGPSDTELIKLESVNVFEFIDQTLVDGTYLYAVTSVRHENDQESESAKTQTVSVIADRIAPSKPSNLTLELNGTGIVSRWVVPAVDAEGASQSPQGMTYNLYRTALPQGQNVGDYSAFTPIQSGISTPIALDASPSNEQHSYFVTAIDAAGNQSEASDTAYLNFGLLPVSQLHISLTNNSYPMLLWQHKGNGIDSYRVWRRQGNGDPLLLTLDPIPHTNTTTIYTDTTYNDNQTSNGSHQEVIYSVVAVDEFNVESLGHELLLPALSVRLEKNRPVLLERGVMNQLLFHVDNKGTTAANGLRLFVTLSENGKQRTHQSDLFTVAASATILVPVVVGGYDKLDALTDLSVRLEQKPLINQSITISQTESVEVGSSALTVDLLTHEFTRGGVGKVTFTITNHSDVETEMLMATNNGKADSNEVRLILEDLQGNLLAKQSIRQATGGVINVPSGHSVARIGAKETFTSGEFTINIPAAAPDEVRLRLVIDKYHYQLGKENHVAISGIGTSKEVRLSDSPYYATVTDVEPLVVNAKNGSVTISGLVIDRSTNQPLANVPVNIITVVRGFEKTSTVYADTDGNFVLVYKPDGVAGTYRVSAIHPEMTDRPNHGEFTAEGGSVSPASIDMKVPRNYVQKINLRVRADQSTNLTNIRLVQLPNGMQEVAELPVGVTVNYQSVAAIAANSYKDLILNFIGDNTAADSGVVTYRVEADGHIGTNALGTVTLIYTLSPAAPAITTKPAFIDTGVAVDQSVYEDVLVTNNGLDLLRNAQVELEMRNKLPLPEWIRLSTAASLGDIPVGEMRTVQIIAEPGVGVNDGIYELNLKVKGDNLSVYTVPVFIKVTQSGIGNAFFKISDIYTSTLDANKQIIEGVNRARVQLQHETVPSISRTLNTDAKGEVIFEAIPAGRYTYRITADDHNSASGRIWIKPDVTSSEKVFLMNNLVNVEWSVREITIEDRYEIKLEATFKTNVPAPVVILKPMAVNLPVMKKGEVFQGEFTLTNHGLIRAYDLIQSLPATNDMVRFELLKEIPHSLEPGQVFTLPYRLQALRDFNPASDATATGGGCGSYHATYSVSYKGKCVNDEIITSKTQADFNSNWGCGSAGGSSTGGGGGGTSGGFPLIIRYGGGGNGGVIYSYGGTPISAEPLWCIAETECDDCHPSNGSAK